MDQETTIRDLVEDSGADDAPLRLVLPVSRWVGAWRAALYFSFGIPLALPLIHRWPTLRFVPTAFSNRIGDYSWAILLFALAVCGLLIALNGCRWLLFALWPANHRIEVDRDAIRIHLGPIGTQRLLWEDMTIEYSFESDLHAEDASYDELLEPEDELATRLPRIVHPRSGNAQINLVMKRFTGAPEAELAEKLRPFLLAARQRQNRPIRLPDDKV